MINAEIYLGGYTSHFRSKITHCIHPQTFITDCQPDFKVRVSRNASLQLDTKATNFFTSYHVHCTSSLPLIELDSDKLGLFNVWIAQMANICNAQ